jgi:hypothetical protein
VRGLHGFTQRRCFIGSRLPRQGFPALPEGGGQQRKRQCQTDIAGAMSVDPNLGVIGEFPFSSIVELIDASGRDWP